MSEVKEHIGFKVLESKKREWEDLAKQENRSLSNWLETIVDNHIRQTEEK